MAKPTLYHNPRCSKSRRALELLEASGKDFSIVEYLESPPDSETILDLIRRQGGEPRAFVRTGDDAFKEAGLSLTEAPTAEEVAELLAANPRVMQRPILDGGDKVAIGRPPERILDVLG